MAARARHVDMCSTSLPAVTQGPFWRFRHGLLRTVMLIAAVFASLFGVLFEFGLNDIGRFHANADYLYAASILLLIALQSVGWLSLDRVLQLFLAASFLTFISALVNVPIDQFRGIWFYLLVFVAYMVGGNISGLSYTVLSILAILGVANSMDLQLTTETLVSMSLGLVIFSLLSWVSVRQMFCYAGLIESKNQELAYLATRDPLTGILNCRAYQDAGSELFASVRHSGQALTLLYMDIDRFKVINDTHGHHVGDAVLVCVVNTVSAVLRQADIFARVGGEEFCVLLAGANRDMGLQLAEKVRQAVEHATCETAEAQLKPTISIGVTTRRDADRSLLDLEKRADQALYTAKQGGRNRVCADTQDVA